MSFVCEAEKSEMKVRRTVDGTVEQTVSDHLPSDKLKSINVLRKEDGIRANVSAQCVNALKKHEHCKVFTDRKSPTLQGSATSDGKQM